jgi:hypothetical protein
MRLKPVNRTRPCAYGNRPVCDASCLSPRLRWPRVLPPGRLVRHRYRTCAKWRSVLTTTAAIFKLTVRFASQITARSAWQTSSAVCNHSGPTFGVVDEHSGCGRIMLSFPFTERWPSGRRHQIANLAYWQRYRGFESLPLRQNKKIFGLDECKSALHGFGCLG